jgi:predicted nucleic acid-binding protein
MLGEVRGKPLEIAGELDLSEAIGVEAARLRRRHPISLPDAYCLATAKHTSSAVSSFDQEILKAATRAGIKAA